MPKVIFINLVMILVLYACSSPSNKPNVIVLTLDTLRADAVNCYGNPTIETPHLNRIAAEGVMFRDAICQIPATLTSHTAIMTGRNPKNNTVRFRTFHVPETEETMAERFQAYGYSTAAFISAYVLSPAFGLNQGFDRYELGSIMQNDAMVQFERPAEDTIDQAIEYLEQTNGRPFFIWVHLYDPHSPYNAPEPYTKQYDPDYSGPFQGTTQEITQLKALDGESIQQRDLEHLRARYYGEVAYMDHHIGRLLGKLDELSLLDKTIIAALSDHGENLGERGNFFHGDDLYQPSIHIPFMIRYPAAIEPGQIVEEMVQSIDLFPTLLNLTNIPRISGLDGESLVPLFQKSTRSTYEKHPGYIETEADVVTQADKRYGLRTDRYKFIYNQAYRRPETPLGIMAEIPLKGPTLVMMRIKGDPSVRLMAHIRYRTQALYTSRDYQALSRLNTTIIHAESFGGDPLHREAMEHDTFLKTPEGWRLQVTPDLYRLAKNYGENRGWPVDWMVLEGVGVDASLPYFQQSGAFTIDQIELYAPHLKFPNSVHYRAPFWVIENFERPDSRGLIDAGEGPAHTIQSEWVNESLFGGKRQQKITITYQDDKAITNELYDIAIDPNETANLVASDSIDPDILKIADHAMNLLDRWIVYDPSEGRFAPLTSSDRETLEALGYIK